jgi:hypothetical protein
MEKKKQKYEPPKISRITIIAEESVLSPCKTSALDNSGKAGTGNPTCNGVSCQQIFGS